MPTAEETLRAAGIELTSGDDWPDLRIECARLARFLHERRARAVGLVPAADDVAVPAVALALGRALADRSALVGVVDGLGTWPCAHGLTEGAPHDGTLVVTNWLSDNLALLTPSGDGGPALARLQGIVGDRTAAFKYFVVDLTGFDHLGDQIAAHALLDSVVLVARSGRTRAGRIRRWLRSVPSERGLGVLLTGT